MRSNVILRILLLTGLVIAGYPLRAFSASGCLDIISDPDGVDIYIDGRPEGKTPINCLAAPAGKVTIEAKKEGYHIESRKVIVKLKGVTKIKIPMKLVKKATAFGQGETAAENSMGSLVIFNLLGQLDVYIDGEKKGRGSMSISDIATGMHELKVGDFSKEIRISEDQKLRIKADNDGITVLSAPDEDGLGKTALNEASKPIAERDGRFIRYADGVVKDTKTGLEWIAGPDRNVTWLDARDWIMGLSTDGGGWRMPTKEELEGLYQKGKGKRNMTPLLKTTGWRVWAVERKGSHSAQYFDFYVGSKILDFRMSNHPRAFAVRSR